MSIQTELNRISENISNAYAAAQEMGAELPSLLNSGNLETTIRSIPKGASILTPPDPMDVYKSTRPADWLEMPEPQDNEMFLLFHIPEDSSALLAFTVTCTGDYTVSIGTVVNGNFVPSETSSTESGTAYETELSASDFASSTSDGMVQAMIKISGTDILTWEPSVHSAKSTPSNYTNWNIVDISCRLPSGTSVCPGSSSANRSLKKLQYFSWKGPNAVVGMINMFRSCYSLLAVLALDTSSVQNADHMFSTCYNLKAVPQMDCPNLTVASYMFSYCYTLSAVPQLNTPQMTNMNYMFRDCYALVSMPQMDTSKVTSMSNAFANCHSLSVVQALDTSKLSSASSLFGSCCSLNKITLKPTVSGWAGCDISLANASLGHSAAVDLLNSLPTITGSKTLTLTGSPGAALLTDDEKAIATSKNWSLTL